MTSKKNSGDPIGFVLETAEASADRENEGAVIELVDQIGEPIVHGPDKAPFWMRVAGSYSTHYKRAVDKQRRRMVKRRGRGKLTEKELAENQIELETACVLDWGGIFTPTGEPLEYSAENVRAVLASRATWIREQVQQQMEDHEAFFSGA